MNIINAMKNWFDKVSTNQETIRKHRRVLDLSQGICIFMGLTIAAILGFSGDIFSSTDDEIKPLKIAILDFMEPALIIFTFMVVISGIYSVTKNKPETLSDKRRLFVEGFFYWIVFYIAFIIFMAQLFFLYSNIRVSVMAN
jgi:hypothetical protein